MSPAAPADAAPRRVLITICVMMAAIMQTLDSTIANVALPYMQGTMSASQEEINWVLTSYIVASAIMTAPMGYLVGRFGRTRVFVLSTAGFTVASIFCGMAQSLDQIVLCRILQGAFGASLMPLSQNVLLDIWPPEQRGSAMAIWIMGALVGPVLGPTLGGWLTFAYSWRWVFYINVPFGLLSSLGLLLFLRETRASREVKLDWTGFLALSLGIGALQTLLDRGTTLDWFSSREIQIEAVLSGLGFYIFAVQSALAEKPFLSPRLLQDVQYSSAILVMGVVGLLLYATLALLAPYLQELMNYPVATAGVVLAPRGLGAMIASMAAGRLLGKVSTRNLVGLGFLCNIVALYDMTLWTPDISQWTVMWSGFVQGAGVSLISVPLAATAFNTLPVELRAEGAGILSLMRNLGSSIGISVTAALLVSNTQVNHAIIGAAINPFSRVMGFGLVPKFWNPASAGGAMALDNEITRQSSIIAYLDDFKLMLICTIVSLPILLLIRGGRPKPAAAAAQEAELAAE